SQRMFRPMDRHDIRIKAALRDFAAVPPELQDLIAASADEFAELVKASLPHAPINDVIARPPTAVERANTETEVLMEKMGIGEIAEPPDPYDCQRAYGTYLERAVDKVGIAENTPSTTGMHVHDPIANAILGMSETSEPNSRHSNGKSLLDLA